MGVFARSRAKTFWIASSELPPTYFRCCYYDDGGGGDAARLLFELPKDAFVFVSYLRRGWACSKTIKSGSLYVTRFVVARSFEIM